MNFVVRCIEPQARPTLTELEIGPGEGFAVFVLEDAVESSTDLRATILRRRGDFPPVGALLLAELDVPVQAEADPAMLVRLVDRGIDLEWIRPGLRARVQPNTQLGAGARLEVTLPSQRRVGFALECEVRGRARARAALAGSGTTGRGRATAQSGVMWLIPGTFELLNDTRDVAFEAIKSVASRFGLSPRMVANLASVLSLVFVGGLAWYSQYKQTQEARAEAKELGDAVDRARAGAAMALQGEQACLVERQALVDRLGDEAAGRTLQVDAALEASASQGVALSLGGARMGEPAVRTRDEASLAVLRERLVALLPDLPKPGREVRRCLAFERLLGTDVPRYTLLWHPDPERSCPADYAAPYGDAWTAGRWGLSDRVAKEFDIEALAADEGVSDPEQDPRLTDRWSARILTEALRETEAALLSYDVRGRLPVAPSQAQLWSLTLFSAYNAMPSPAEGVLDQPLDVCVDELLDQLSVEAPPAGVGRPLLPDLIDVAEGRVPIGAAPSPGCPWPARAVEDGARAVLVALGRAAHAANSPDGDKEEP